MVAKPYRVDGKSDRWLLRGALICFALAFLLLSLIVFSGCASSRTGKALNVAVVGSGVADYLTTRDAITSGRGREANPVMGQGAIRQALIKAGGVGYVIGMAWLVERHEGSRLMAHLIRWTAAITWSIVAYKNHQVGR